jgi:hypothetical protein
LKIGQKQSVSNPTPGAVIEVPAGESVELLFTCNNDQPKVLTFELESSGLGSWASEKTEHAVSPFDTSNLSFVITPKRTAEMGDYPFTVRLTCGGDLVEPMGERALMLRVLEGAPIPAEPEPPATIPVAKLAPEKPSIEENPAPAVEKPSRNEKPPVNENPPVAEKSADVEKPKVERKPRTKKLTADASRRRTGQHR